MDKGHYTVTRLPPGIKECWFYTGKQSSIHIVLDDVETEILINDIKYKIQIPIPQINLDLPSIIKAKVKV